MESSCVSVHTEEAGMGKEITFEIPYIRLRFLTELLADAGDKNSGAARRNGRNDAQAELRHGQKLREMFLS